MTVPVAVLSFFRIKFFFSSSSCPTENRSSTKMYETFHSSVRKQSDSNILFRSQYHTSILFTLKHQQIEVINPAQHDNQLIPVGSGIRIA